MENTETARSCTNCGVMGAGKYCNNCGNNFTVKRITTPGILHDVFHFFTHLDKGFGYTLKQLIVAPGTMQREYIEGQRSKHQKPFSMFFICASVTALVRYWIDLSLTSYYHSANAGETNFFHQYMVLMHSLLLPLYALVTFLIFYKSKYNYAEIAVFLLYTVGMFFLITDLIAALRLVWPNLDTDYIELVSLGLYNAVTCLHFFNNSNKWVVLVKSVISMVGVYFIANFGQDFVISLLKH